MDDLDDSDDCPPGLPPPETRTWRHPSELRSASRVAWGLPDAALCWLMGLFAGVVATIPVVAFETGPQHEPTSAATFLVALPAQNLTILAALFWVSRAKGVGTWRADFGFEIRRRDAGALLVGGGLQVLLTVIIAPLARLAGRPRGQELVQLIDNNRSLPLTVGILVATTLIAPVVEELLFRGLLLRSLLRRLEPARAVLISGVIFGLVHLTDPGALVAVPGLAALGTILSMMALRTNSLSRPILLHAGFNFTATVLALTT